MSNRTTERTQPVPALIFVLSPADITKDYFVALAADKTTTTGSPGTALLTLAFVLAEARDVLIQATFCATVVSTPARFIVRINGGAALNKASISGATVGGGALQWKASLPAGAHTVELMWAAADGVNIIYCRPVAEHEGATLLVRALGNVEVF